MDNRSQARRFPQATIQIINTITGRTLGVLVNLSKGGFMMMSQGQGPNPGEIYQLQLLEPRNHELDLVTGATCLWRDEANAENCYWSGFQFIEMSPEARKTIQSQLLALDAD